MSVTHLERGRAELDVYCGQATGIALLAREIHTKHLGLKQALSSQLHSVSKRALQLRLIQLEEAIRCWMLVTGRMPYGSPTAASDDATCAVALEVLHINLPRLREGVGL